MKAVILSVDPEMHLDRWYSENKAVIVLNRANERFVFS
ncbi:hypothetical protein PALB_15750 [Pseudoalteromonas luteoviolacea B = ATCC 29581]|nr:hypothetical protein PALB_15750 [Pseudoalteromonas luteoviolacea B = ATCC 29581]